MVLLVWGCRFRSKCLYLKKAHYFLLQPSVSSHFQRAAGPEDVLKKHFSCHAAGRREAGGEGRGHLPTVLLPPKKTVKCQENQLGESGISCELFPG